MNYAAFIVEVVSALLCFILVKFMLKPYQGTGETRYIGLPVGFALLGSSYVFMAAALYFTSFPFVDELKWLQIFSEAFAFAFVAVTYYFSKKPTKNSRLMWNTVYACLAVLAVILYLILVEPPMYGLSTLNGANEDVLFFNIVCLTYISVYTLRNHALKPDAQTMLIPFGYVLLGFSQYSLLIWSLDSSFSAFVGANFLRLVGLLIFLFVSYKSFRISQEQSQKEGVMNEKTPS